MTNTVGFAGDAAGELQHGLVTGRRVLLRQITNRRRFLDRDRPLVRYRLAEDEREKRALARAIGADQADPIAAVHLQRSVLEKRPTAKRLRHLRNGQHNGRGMSPAVRYFGGITVDPEEAVFAKPILITLPNKLSAQVNDQLLVGRVDPTRPAPARSLRISDPKPNASPRR